jgi:putative ABC transport system permease protein
MIAGLARRARADAVVALNIFHEAVASLRSRLMQAALSSFGIATGITAVVLLVSIVSGVHRFMLETMGMIGGNLIQVNTTPMRSTQDPRGFQVTLRPADLKAVMDGSEYYDAGMAENASNALVRTARRSTRDSYLRGVTEQGFEVLNLHAASGRLFLDSEYASGARVAVIGADLAQELFVQESPVGQAMVIGEWPFHVVGVLDWVGDPNAGIPAGPDNGIYLPFKAVVNAFRGNESCMLRLRLASPDLAEAAVAETKRILDRQRRQRGETSGEVQVTNTIDRIAQLATVLTTIKLVVGLVGGIALFVGAVGVANVLRVRARAAWRDRSATGLGQPAVRSSPGSDRGAGHHAVGWPGDPGGVGLTKVAILIPQIPAGARPHISLATGVAAVVLLTIVGLVAGVGPARRAAAVFPAEALRAE